MQFRLEYSWVLALDLSHMLGLLGAGDQTHTASWTLDKRFTELHPKPIICCFKGFLFIFMVMCYIMIFPSRLHTSQWSHKIKLPTSSINNVCTTIKLPCTSQHVALPWSHMTALISSSVHCRSQWCWDIYLYGIPMRKNKCKEHYIFLKYWRCQYFNKTVIDF